MSVRLFESTHACKEATSVEEPQAVQGYDLVLKFENVENLKMLKSWKIKRDLPVWWILIVIKLQLTAKSCSIFQLYPAFTYS